MLTNHGFTVTTAQNVQTALDDLNSHISAFLLLGLDLEGAVPFLEKVIDTFYNLTPYILAVGFFPCSQSQADILNLDADACLEKSLDLEEVLAVINAVLQRVERLSKPKPLHTMPRIEHKGLTIDPLRRHVSINGQSISLTVKEFDTLYLLASYRGIVLSKAQIYEQVWNEDYQFVATSVSDHISSLRKKLEAKMQALATQSSTRKRLLVQLLRTADRMGLYRRRPFHVDQVIWRRDGTYFKQQKTEEKI